MIWWQRRGVDGDGGTVVFIWVCVGVGTYCVHDGVGCIL